MAGGRNIKYMRRDCINAVDQFLTAVKDNLPYAVPPLARQDRLIGEIAKSDSFGTYPDRCFTHAVKPIDRFL